MASSVRYIWKIYNFSQLCLNNKGGYHESDVFSAAGAKWKVKIYPMGSGEVFDHLSLYLCCENSADFPVNVKYKFAITSQTNPANTKTVVGEQKFVSTTVDRRWGYVKFLPLSQLHDSSKGYIVNDTCEIIIEITRQIAADVKKSVKQGGKAKPVVKQSSSWFNAITCICCCSSMTTTKIAGIAEKQAKPVIKQSNSRYSAITCICCCSSMTTTKVSGVAEKQAKPVIKQSNSRYSAITCICCCSSMTTTEIAGVAENPVKLEGKQSVKEDIKQSSRAKSVVKSN